MSRLLTFGTDAPPQLRLFLNLMTLDDLPAHSAAAGLRNGELWERLNADGFEGVQLTTRDPVPQGLNLPYCGLDRINLPSEADDVIKMHADRGDLCVTLHLGWGMEDDDEAQRLVQAVLEASDAHRLPAFIETHRATITQDIWRTVQLTKAIPDIRFNADFSHYYCGQEMVYGDFEAKLDFLEPVFTRTGFIHGRVAGPGSMQIPVLPYANQGAADDGGGPDSLAHFREIWTRAMQGFLSGAGPGTELIFAPELLTHRISYARRFPGKDGRLVEESERYAEAVAYLAIARNCWSEAQRRHSG
jgi:hypothetical protein